MVVPLFLDFADVLRALVRSGIKREMSGCENLNNTVLGSHR
jgi:hypothetical protein